MTIATLGEFKPIYCSSRLALNKLKLSTEWEMEGIHGDVEGKQGVISYLKKKKKDAGKEPGNAENMVLTVFLSEYQGCHLLLVASMNSLNVLQ